jgi:hypothetical protein
VKPPPNLPAGIIAETEWITREPQFAALDEVSKSKLHKLCEDKRLKVTWHRLSKTKPIVARAELIDQWTHHWRSSWTALDKEWSDSELALQLAFRSAFFRAIPPYLIKSITVTEKNQVVDSYRERAKRLRAEADAFLKEGAGHCNLANLPVGDPQEHAQAVNRAAAWCEAEADELAATNNPCHPLHDELVVRRHQAPAHVRGYVMMLAKTIRGLYGQDLRTTVADIATVALSYNSVSPHDVRYWCENKRR